MVPRRDGRVGVVEEGLSDLGPATKNHRMGEAAASG